VFTQFKLNGEKRRNKKCNSIIFAESPDMINEFLTHNCLLRKSEMKMEK